MSESSRGRTKTRAYDGSRRRAAAEERRQRVAEAAAELFTRDGWSATRLADVAQAAGVSTELVAKAFGSKQGLLMAAMRFNSFQEYANLQEAFAALDLPSLPEPRERLARLADFVVSSTGPMARMVAVMAVASDQDPQLKSMLDASREGQVRTAGVACEQIATLPVTEEMVDELAFLTRAETWLMLVVERGWSPEMFADWFTRRAGAILGV